MDDKGICTSTGIPTGMEFGMLRSLESVQKKYPGQEIILCWDAPNARATRQEIDPEYKSTRRTGDSDVWDRLNAMKPLLYAAFSNAIYEGLEADDVLCALAKVGDGPNYIYTNDKDMLQAIQVEPDVTVLKSHKGRLFEWDQEKVFEKHEIWPDSWVLFRALTGDPSDNIHGSGALIKSDAAQMCRKASREELVLPVGRDKVGSALLLQDASIIAGWCNAYVNDKFRLSVLKQCKWESFFDSGHLARNIRLIRCIPCRPEIAMATGEDDLIQEYMKRWEIKSLGMCNATSDEEEF